jgi:hypothetical protein
VSGNLVLDAGMDGIAVGYTARADSNVVGRAGGVGVRVDLSSGFPGHARHNTVYQSAGAGFELAGANADSITHNIAYANGGAGLVWSGTGVPVLGCNDWFANSGGATSGVAPGASDLAVDPLFCNVAQDDVTLSQASSLLAAPGCGQIGARGEGCTAAVSVTPGTDEALTRLRVFPHPTRGQVNFAWPESSLPARIEVFDVSGARRWERGVPAGTHHLTWDLADTTGERLAPGVYWARVNRGGEVFTSRVVLLP